MVTSLGQANSTPLVRIEDISEDDWRAAGLQESQLRSRTGLIQREIAENRKPDQPANLMIAGIVLTVWRLRSAKLPLGLCILFFVPILNLIFFAVLCAIPERRERHLPTVRRAWTAWLPTSRVGSALLSTFIVGILGAGLAVISTRALENYGWVFLWLFPLSWVWSQF